MGAAREKAPAVRVVGLLSPAGAPPAPLLKALERIWGPVRSVSGEFPFEATRYYEREMGPGLVRRFAAFRDLADAAGLRAWKRESNELEIRLSEGDRRGANIDPGYLDLGGVVVASTKDASFRVYLGEGIYAQPMLRYESGSFRPWPWTYRDYAAEGAVSFFNGVREGYRASLSRGPRGGGGSVCD